MQDETADSDSEAWRTNAEKVTIEKMVTAVLAASPSLQGAVADGLSPSEERYVRAAASIIAGLFTALGSRMGLSGAETWRRHMTATLAHRERSQQSGGP